MQRSQLREISSWMARLLPEPSDSINKTDGLKLTTSRSSTANSIFYTDLELSNDDDGEIEKIEETVDESELVVNNSSSSSTNLQSMEENDDDDDKSSDDSKLVVESINVDKESFIRHSYQRIQSFNGFSRPKGFISLDANGSVESNGEQTQSIIRMTHSVLEYRNSRYSTTNRSSNQHILDSYAVSESESEEEETEDNHSSDIKFIDIDNSKDNLTNVNDDITDGKRKKAQKIAEELLKTEKSYVNILHLIDQIFQFRIDQENRAHPMFPPLTVQHMFSNIKSIYIFHNDFLLPQLEDRIKLWNDNPRIGDILKNFAPFLKMYTEYVKNFDYAMYLINTFQQKVPRFAAIIDEIQKSDDCGKLTLSHHMLSPIQRLPRYELLLKDYLKNLAEDSPEYQDTQVALKLVSTAANHTNEEMKKIDKFKKLLEIQESIYDPIDLVSATRELIKEGRIVKISARSGDHQERHLFLFSDILLLCSIRLIPGPMYRLRAKFIIENLEVIEGDNLETANTFYLSDNNKSVELYTQSAAQKAAWLDALFQAMQEIIRRKSSLKTGDIKTDDVTKCMICEIMFSVMKRKYNCKACGMVVCNKCSNQKMLFEDSKNVRVCRLCHDSFAQPINKSPSLPGDHGPSLLQVSANSPCVISGYLFLKTQASKPWTRRWFALHADFVLYTFKSDAENIALTATPMPGFKITDGLELTHEDPLNLKDRKGTFKIHHSRKYYYLKVFSLGDKERWINALTLATRAELPHLTEDLPQQNETIDNLQSKNDE